MTAPTLRVAANTPLAALGDAAIVRQLFVENAGRLPRTAEEYNALRGLYGEDRRWRAFSGNAQAAEKASSEFMRFARSIPVGRLVCGAAQPTVAVDAYAVACLQTLIEELRASSATRTWAAETKLASEFTLVLCAASGKRVSDLRVSELIGVLDGSAVVTPWDAHVHLLGVSLREEPALLLLLTSLLREERAAAAYVSLTPTHELDTVSFRWSVVADALLNGMRNEFEASARSADGRLF